MKYSPHLYAKAFTTVAAEYAKEKQGVLVKNFLAVVHKNGDMFRINRIVSLAENILIKQRGGKKWIVESARLIKDAKNILKGIAQPQDVIEERINSALIAGVNIIQDGEKQFDGSLQRKIAKLFS